MKAKGEKVNLFSPGSCYKLPRLADGQCCSNEVQPDATRAMAT